MTAKVAAAAAEPVHRVLIKTHHMTSRKKIRHLTHAAARLDCAVVLKTGTTPGVMLAEGARALEWLATVKTLRYKDFQLRRKEAGVRPGLALVRAGDVVAFARLADFSAFLARNGPALLAWWRVHMGYTHDADAADAA
ncbi:hypothetical protein K3495_g10062 [Podosphaera aphanis]|nr:hypothetical protein K3495_g10062 [Podosphaera aphanis]